MDQLKLLLMRFARARNARWWAGNRPAVPDGQIERTLAVHIGYPTSLPDPLSNGGMVSLDRGQAAHVLAVAATTSLAYGNADPSNAQVAESYEALGDLHADATFRSNGLWAPDGPRSWNALTDATFDCGVMGWDSENAFIFWVEEED